MVQALTIDVEARFAQVMDGLDSLNAKTSKTVQSMDSAFGGLKATLAGLAGAFTVDALSQKFGSAVKAMADLDDAAQMTGASVESLSSILNTLAPTGVTLETITGATEKLVKSMQGADEETKGAGAAFAALGISVRDGAGNLRSSDQVLIEIAQSLAKYEDGANKVAIAQAIFGKSGASLLPMLKDLAEQQKASSTVSAEQAQAAADLEDKWRKLKVQGDQFAQTIASQIIPGLTKLLDQFTKGIEVAGGFWAALGKFGLANPFKTPADQINSLSTELENQGAIIKRNQALVDGTASAFGRGARNAAQGRVDDANKRIDEINRELQYWRMLEEQQGKVTNLKNNALYGDNSEPKGKTPKLPTGGGTDKKGAIERAELTDEQKAIVDAFKAIDGVQQRARSAASTLQLLDQMFFEGSLTAKQYDDIVKQIFKTSETAGDAALAAVEKQAEAWRDAIDPARAYRRQLAEINELEEKGRLTASEAVKARAEVFTKIGDLTKTATESVKDQRSEVEKLGLQFVSSFENAAVKGEGFRAVLQALLQDIAKLGLRQQFTMPLFEAATSFFKPSATSWTSGSDLPTGDLWGKNLANVSAQQVKSYTIAPVINIDSRSDQALIRQQVEAGVAKSIALSNDMRARGAMPA